MEKNEHFLIIFWTLKNFQFFFFFLRGKNFQKFSPILGLKFWPLFLPQSKKKQVTTTKKTALSKWNTQSHYSMHLYPEKVSEPKASPQPHGMSSSTLNARHFEPFRPCNSVSSIPNHCCSFHFSRCNCLQPILKRIKIIFRPSPGVSADFFRPSPGVWPAFKNS